MENLELSSFWITVAVPIGATVVGGLLSLLGSYWSLNRAAKIESDRVAKEDRKREALKAYAAFHKLLGAFNAVQLLKEQIDEMFRRAHEEGRGDSAPWSIVREVVRHPHRDTPILAEDITFLVGVRRTELINDILSVQRCAWSIEASMQKYSEIRRELTEFLSLNGVEGAVKDGTVVSAELPKSERFFVETKIGTLNSLIGRIIERLEADIPWYHDALVKFKSVSEECFSDDFPAFELEALKKC